MFDGAEMGVFSLVGKRALEDLMPVASTDAAVKLVESANRDFWFGVITAAFLVGAATGGVVFGWLGDRIGRVRAMTFSVLVYALFSGLCGYAQNAGQLGILRFIAALGMGGEWSLGVALVMEVWPNRSRPFMAGLIGAAANVGYMMVGFVGLYLTSFLDDLAIALPKIGLSDHLVGTLLHNNGWRIMMMLGTTPALLTFFIRLFVPESERWQEEQDSGATSNWVGTDLLGVLVGAGGPALIVFLWAYGFPAISSPSVVLAIRLAGTLLGLAIATAGYTYPCCAICSGFPLPAACTREIGDRSCGGWRLAASLSAVALLGTWGTTQWGPKWADGLAKQVGAVNAAEWTQIWSSIGAIVGTILAAMMGDWFGRRITYTLMCATAFVSVLVFYFTNNASTYGSFYFFATTFVAGGCSASFYGWLPLYLPELFPTNVRATGQGFGFNFGRIIAAVGVLQVGNLFVLKYELFGRIWTGQPLACSLMALIYFCRHGHHLAGAETRGKPLPD